MSGVITEQRCFVHRYREAAARCVTCGMFFCRECVTEHEGRLICAACLKKTTSTTGRRRKFAEIAGYAFQFVLSCLFLWFMFYQFGRILLSLPESFHEGTVWQETAAEPPST